MFTGQTRQLVLSQSLTHLKPFYFIFTLGFRLLPDKIVKSLEVVLVPIRISPSFRPTSGITIEDQNLPFFFKIARNSTQYGVSQVNYQYNFR